jgi:hypothetical protein
MIFPEHRLRFVRIPKNACSTVIASLGASVVGDGNPHPFTNVFTQPVEGSGDWPTIAVYRDPYDRLVSAYLDKLIAPRQVEPFAMEMAEAIWRTQRLAPRPTLHTSVTFREMVYYVADKADDELDVHWKSQAGFLRFAKPTIELRMDRLAEDWSNEARLSAILLRTFDRHSTKSDAQGGESLVDAAGESIHGFRVVSSSYPARSRFNDEHLEAIVRKRFAADYELLARLSGESVRPTDTNYGRVGESSVG